MLSFDDLACLVRLHDELVAVDRREDAEVLRRVVAANTPSHQPPPDESPEARRRRQAKERQQRARDRRSPSRNERDASVTVRDAGSVTVRDELRDASRVTLRDEERDDLRDAPGPAIAQPAVTSALSALQGSNGERDASVTSSVTVRDASRSASRLGGKGGVVAVAVSSSLFKAENYQEHTETTARERDDLRDAERDASRSITLHRVDRPRRVAAMPTAASILDRPELARTSERLGALATNTQHRESAQRLAAELVYRYWVSKLGKVRTLLSAERERCILQRLRENGGNASELCWAIDGLTKSAFHMGRNDAGQRHDDLTVVFRDRTQLEKFAGQIPGWARGEEHPFVRDARAELLTASEAPELALSPAEVANA